VNHSRRRGKLHSLLCKKGKATGKLFYKTSKQSYYKIKRKEIYRITNLIINGENTVFNLINVDNEEELTFISISNIQRHFLPNYASTIASIQGRRIDEPFSIWEMNKRFSRDELNSAVGRGTCRLYPHFENTDSTIIYKWSTGKTHIMLNSEVTNVSYGSTSFYLILDKGKPIYRGHTTLTVGNRLQQHLKQARENPKNKFHHHLANSNAKDITIERTDIRSFDCLYEVEKYEMLLLSQDIENGHKMLNSKKKVKDNTKQ
jgi:hypothetical protein